MKRVEIERKKYSLLFKKYVLLLIFLDIFTLSLFSIYALGFQLEIFGAIIAVIFLITFFLNILYLLLLERFLNKKTEFGKFQSIVMIVVICAGIGTIIGIEFSNMIPSDPLIVRMILLSFFHVLSIAMALLSYNQLKKDKEGFLWE